MSIYKLSEQQLRMELIEFYGYRESDIMMLNVKELEEVEKMVKQ